MLVQNDVGGQDMRLAIHSSTTLGLVILHLTRSLSALAVSALAGSPDHNGIARPKAGVSTCSSPLCLVEALGGLASMKDLRAKSNMAARL